MKNTFILTSLVVVAALSVYGQPDLPPGYVTVRPIQSMETVDLQTLTVSPSEVPLFSTTVTGYDGITYTGTFMGRSPFNRAKTTTSIVTQVIPILITITDGEGAIVYDPTTPNSCFAGSPTDVSIITGSPIFNGANYTMNGVNVTPTTPSQYIDAFQRANYWTVVGGTNWHTNLTLQVLPTQSLSFNSSVAQNYTAGVDFGGGCGHIGVVDINTFNAAIQTLLKGLAAVNPGTFPILLTKDVVQADPGHNLFGNCCVLGYHSAYTSGPNVQVYSPFSLSAPQNFGGDVSTLAHEMAEAVADPLGNNPVPNWGNIGQQSGCQNNLEVGDPLSQAFNVVPTNFVVNLNGFTYHLQELAFTTWFYGNTNTGVGGKYSNNGALSGHAKACPPGGTF